MQRRADGFSILELLIVVAMIGILSSIFIPAFLCAVYKSRHATYQENGVHARDAAVSFFVTHGRWPDTLEDAYVSGAPPPAEWLYCVDEEDPDRGFGNGCDRDDADNPSGNNGPWAIDIQGFRLWTKRGLCPPCAGLDVSWMQVDGASSPPVDYPYGWRPDNPGGGGPPGGPPGGGGGPPG